MLWVQSMSAMYNEYVLTTSLEQGWLKKEQADQVRVLITANPKMAALDLMEEQQLLAGEHVAMLRGLIAQAGVGKRHRTAAWCGRIWSGQWRWGRVICIWDRMPPPW